MVVNGDGAEREYAQHSCGPAGALPIHAPVPHPHGGVFAARACQEETWL
jgi:hypothetical protein